MDLKKDINRLVPKLFEHDKSLSLVNTTWPKLKKTYKKALVVWLILGSKLQTSFLQ